ncbi:MAG: hypothetical protein JSS86_10000 [Cyanobacteria bacterium SZAS LIN-2]|nr:hypothetical protein [Cyanobacteria bacterium SZAS LIN-2]MBS2009487.1 hypothetical protein [Cyanobacteria bacterium SZAS TMP-1]
MREQRVEQVKKAFLFIRERALTQIPFSSEELIAATGWARRTVATYISKQWIGYLKQIGRGPEKQYFVSRQFLRVTEKEFLEVATQKRLVVPNYKRSKHEQFIQYEFLLPLSKEEQLRRALDDLFYANTLETLIREISLEKLSTLICRDKDTDDSCYIHKVRAVVGDYFGGYSISHVQGRFRAAELIDIVGAAEATKENSRYLIDETTAVVRFIAPCYSAKSDFDDDFDAIVVALKEDSEVNQLELEKEISLIRCLFFFFFVEAVVRTVKGEDEIWLIETGPKRRLYRWMRS